MQRTLLLACLMYCVCLVGTGIASGNQAQDLQFVNEHLIEYQDFPKPGVRFYDVSGILKQPQVFKKLIDILVAHYKGQKIDAILALDARGFLFATPLAYQLEIPVVMIRKPGKLPGVTINTSLTKEYAQDAIEMQTDALLPNQRVIIIDDLIATGGTIKAAIKLVRQAHAEVIEVVSIVELTAFKTTRDLDVNVYSVIQK